MRIHRLRLENVRGIDAQQVDFADDGVTVVCAPNESGKTTLVDALDVLFTFKATSTATKVRQLQPMGRDVGSTIEVEMTCGQVHLTCRKTFNKDRSSELTIHAPTPDTFTGDAAHDQLRHILKGSTDLALFEALRFEQGRDLEAVGLDNSTVLAARLDDAAGGGGATADDALFDRADQQRRQYFTPTGREGKVLIEADDHVGDLIHAHSEALDRRQQVERDIAELTRLQEELPILQRRRTEELHPRMQELRDKLVTVRNKGERLAARVAERDRALQAYHAAKQLLADRTDRAEQASVLEKDVTILEAELGPMQERVDTLEQRLAELDQQIDAEERAVEVARRQRDQAELQLDHVAATEEADQINARLEVIERSKQAVLVAERSLASISLDDQLLEEIRTAERERFACQAAVDAVAPTVAITPRTPIRVQLDGEEHHLHASQTWHGAITERLDLDIAEVGTLAVDASGATKDVQRELAEAQARLARACQSGGVADPDEAEQVAQLRSRHQQDLQRGREALQQVLGDDDEHEVRARLHTLQDQIASLTGQLETGATLPRADAARADRDAARRAAAEAEQQLEQLRTRRTELTEDLQAVRDRVVGIQAHHRQLQQRHQQMLDGLHDERETRSDELLSADVAVAERDLDTAEDAVHQARQQHDELEPEMVQMLAETAEKRLADLDQRVEQLQLRREGLRTRLELAGEDGLAQRVDQLAASLTRARRERDRLRARAGAARLLFEMLQQARDEAYKTYRDPLRERIVEQARLLYGSDDVDVELGDQLQIVSRTLDGTRLEWGQLSAGAREQLAILSGLAAARIAGDDGVPFILDDALGYTDPGRLERLGALLGQVSDVQVIVLTCDPDRFQYVGGAHRIWLDELRSVAS